MKDQCPICQTPYTEYQDTICAGCAWDLTPYPLSLNSIPDEFLEKEQRKIAWAKQVWQKLLQQEQEERKLTEQLLEAQKRPSVDVVELLSGLQKELAHIRQEKKAPKSRWEWEEVQQERSQLQKQNEQLQQQVVSLQEKLKTTPPPPLPPPSYTFTVVKLDERGKEVQRYTKSAELYKEKLGNGIVLEMVKIPPAAGMSFTHMGIYPVTQGQYEAIMGTNPSYFKKGNDFPVENVSWDEAHEFCALLSERTGKTYRLPLEKEWEYACRAGTTTGFHFGPTITTDVVTYNGNYPFGAAPKGEYQEETTKVGSFGVANDFGLYDMHGNVGEWCGENNYDGDTDYRPIRGGAWNLDGNSCRCDYRDYYCPDYGDCDYGFRVVL